MIDSTAPVAGGAPRAPQRIGILTTDTALVVTSWDANLAAMTGVSADAAVGRSLTELIPDFEARHLLDVLREPLETGVCRVLAPALHRYLIRCPPPPLSQFDQMRQRVVIGPLRDHDRTLGLAITIEDVTARLEREQALAAELRRAEPAARLRAIEALEAHEPVDGAGPLRAAIADDDWQVRRAAVRAIASRRDPSIVETLVTALREQHRDFSVLSSALQLLTMTGVDLTAALIDLLHHDDADLRIQAALALGTQPDPAAVDALLTALDDPDVNVRFHAIEALGKLGPAAAVDRLAAIAESNDFFLAFPALDALARISDPSVAPRVVPLLGDALVGDQAAEVLGHIGDEEAVVPLVRALDRPEASVVTIVEALVAVGRRYRETLGVAGQIEDLARRAMSPSGAQRIIDAAAKTADASLKSLVIVLGWLRGPAVERALTHLLGASSAHQELIEAIVRFGSPMVDRLIEQVKDPDLATRRAAVIALGHIGDVRAVPALVEAIAQEDRDLLGPAAGALARLGDARAFEPLVGLLGDDDLAVRHAAIGALNSIGHAGMAARMRALLDAPDPHVRESAVKIAGYFGYRECAEGLIARCHDSDEAVRAAALEHVAYLDDPRVLPLLVEALDRDTPRARAAAVQALAHVSSAEVLAVLRRASADADPWVRYFSVTSLGRQVDRASLPILQRAAEHDAHQPVRIAAVEAIGAIGGDAAADLLAGLTGTAVDEVSIAAITALGQTGSSHALEPLRRALTGGKTAQRAAAAAALARWGHEPTVELLQWTAAGDDDPAVVHSAIAGLSRIGGGTSPVAPLRLNPAIAEGTAAGSSIAGLSRIGGGTSPVAPQAIAALAAVAGDPARRAEAVAALARVPASAIPRVGEALSSRDPHVRHAVVEALGRLSHPVASAYLRSALEDSEPAVRQHAVVVLARLGSRGVARSFADMARNDPSDGVRRAADAALRRSGTDRDPAGDPGPRA